MSRPSMAYGMACAWISDAVFHPSSAHEWHSASARPRDANVRAVYWEPSSELGSAVVLGPGSAVVAVQWSC